MSEELKKLKELSDKAFEARDYKKLKEIRAQILDYKRTHSTTEPSLEDKLKRLSVEQLKVFQQKALTAENNFDIWLALKIRDEIASKS